MIDRLRGSLCPGGRPMGDYRTAQAVMQRACDNTRRTQAWNLDNLDVAIVNGVGVRRTGTALCSMGI